MASSKCLGNGFIPLKFYHGQQELGKLWHFPASWMSVKIVLGKPTAVRQIMHEWNWDHSHQNQLWYTFSFPGHKYLECLSVPPEWNKGEGTRETSGLPPGGISWLLSEAVNKIRSHPSTPCPQSNKFLHTAHLWDSLSLLAVVARVSVSGRERALFIVWFMLFFRTATLSQAIFHARNRGTNPWRGRDRLPAGNRLTRSEGAIPGAWPLMGAPRGVVSCPVPVPVLSDWPTSVLADEE